MRPGLPPPADSRLMVTLGKQQCPEQLGRPAVLGAPGTSHLSDDHPKCDSQAERGPRPSQCPVSALRVPEGLWEKARAGKQQRISMSYQPPSPPVTGPKSGLWGMTVPV